MIPPLSSVPKSGTAGVSSYNKSKSVDNGIGGKDAVCKRYLRDIEKSRFAMQMNLTIFEYGIIPYIGQRI